MVGPHEPIEQEHENIVPRVFTEASSVISQVSHAATPSGSILVRASTMSLVVKEWKNSYFAFQKVWFLKMLFFPLIAFHSPLLSSLEMNSSNEFVLCFKLVHPT